MELRWHHWAVALTIAAVVHVVVLARVHWDRTPDPALPWEAKLVVAVGAGPATDEVAEFAGPSAVTGALAPPAAPERHPARAAPEIETPVEEAVALREVVADTTTQAVAAAPVATRGAPPPAAVPSPEPAVREPLAAATVGAERPPPGTEVPAAPGDPVGALPLADVPAAALPPSAVETLDDLLAAHTDTTGPVPSPPLLAAQPDVTVPLAANNVTPPVEPSAPEATADATVDLELTPIAPGAEISSATAEDQTAIASSPVDTATPVPELASVAPRDTVTARTVRSESEVDLQGVIADYAALLKVWVGRHMHYPVRARLNGIEGTAVMRLVMSRDGRILSYQLERTSGHVELDREAIRTIKRASPFPPLPPEMKQVELKLRLPLVFSVKNYEARRTVPPIYLE